MAADGLSLMRDPYSLLSSPLVVGESDEFILTMREDMPEVVVIFGPGMNVVRVNAAATGPSDPVDKFHVPNAEISHFLDGYASIGYTHYTYID